MMFLICLLLISFLSQEAESHGRLMDPPSRNSMWRFGFINPINYNDNENYCGGVTVQFEQNGGKCGVCGDNYADPQPRDHEKGGTYGNGVITKRYKSGTILPVEVELTTNHQGIFEFKLCPMASDKEIATQECFDKNPLSFLSKPNETIFPIPPNTTKEITFHLDLILPEDLTCHQCVLQWTYNAGNTWGDCGNGTGAVGCGPQETFVNCADIQIFDSSLDLPSNTIENLNRIYIQSHLQSRLVVKHIVCIANGLFRTWPESDKWCQQNCLKYPPYCPPSRCSCLKSCKAIGKLEGVEGTDVYCHRRCLRYPTDCPRMNVNA
ncbi:unnamed protein product [Lepeophtheirus salmonis]|uniref:(salmon louse) hypothetical protein n=1 Tax=Lepeophtheirus salmonis TaxID=72036 RepID=A0A7R8CUS2_LEPSM|nr:unnamed protein product [Lepeophtheirus salmonis]CAF2939000.1 unnamed protein product [Lepeophtheirus salmonis]